MAAKAQIRSGYRGRLGIIAVVLLACTGWFGYDAVVKYPHQAKMYSDFLSIRKQHGETNYWPQWTAHAEAHGWEPVQPEERTQRDIWLQYGCAAVTLTLGLIFGVNFLRVGGRWIASDERGLHTSAGQHAPWADIESVDKTRWAAKGIAVVHYRDGGTSRRITLDDWKYETEPTAALMAEVEARLAGAASADTPASGVGTDDAPPREESNASA